MLKDLRRSRLDVQTRQTLQRKLQRTVRIWPVPDSEEWVRAVELCDGSVPEESVGATLLVCVSDFVDGRFAAASLLHARIGDAESNRDAMELGDDIGRVRETAATALARSLPLVWRTLNDARDAPMSVVHLVTKPLGDRNVRAPVGISGESFGLALALAMASKILETPLPENLAATAGVGVDGALASVDGLAEKIAVIESEAPRIRKLVVAAADHAIAQRHASGLEILAFCSLGEAIDEIFGGAFDQFLRRVGADHETRNEIVDSFFRIAMGGRSSFVDWSPVERGAAVARGWSSLDETQRFKIELAEAVAARHERNDGHIPVPGDVALSSFPIAMRVAIVTHLIQQCADSPRQDRREIEELVERLGYLVPVREAFPPQLRLRGAWARLLAVTGRPRDALEAQEEVARLWLELLAYEETSFQLAEWFRLAGALFDRAAYDRAVLFEGTVSRLGGLGIRGNFFVDLAKARAAVMLGLDQRSAARMKLVELAANGRVPDHVRHSALRWAAHDADVRGTHPEADDFLRELERSPASGKGSFGPEVHLALARAERALEVGQDAAASSHIDEAARHDPGPIRNLIDAAADAREDRVRYVLRFYPY